MSDHGGFEGQPRRDTALDNEPRHFRRLVSIWVISSIVGDLIWFFVAASHVPPGDMTTSAAGVQFDFNVIMLVAIPAVFGVWIFMGYALLVWRESRWGDREPVGGPRAAHNPRVEWSWITVVTLTVLGLFAFGTYELVVPAGAGGGEGPNPIWYPTGYPAVNKVLPIQVIAQQWKFTYRYPTFGGMETNNLVIPNDTTIAFHVTSIDVIHDFWAYQIGIKADANPQVDDVAFTTTQQTGTFTVRCDELCGIWHGAMYTYGRVVSKSQFEKWATSTMRSNADNTKYLPPFAWTYSPTANTTTGVFANTSGQAPYSKIQKYGATTAAQKFVKHPTLTTTTG